MRPCFTWHSENSSLGIKNKQVTTSNIFMLFLTHYQAQILTKKFICYEVRIKSESMYIYFFNNLVVKSQRILERVRKIGTWSGQYHLAYKVVVPFLDSSQDAMRPVLHNQRGSLAFLHKKLNFGKFLI